MRGRLARCNERSCTSSMWRARELASASAFVVAPAIAPSVRIMSNMPAMSRWLNACTAMFLRINSATMSACRSENVSTRPHLRRADGVTGHPDNAAVFAEQIKGFDRFFGQADDSFRRKHGANIHQHARL